jgi:hypothetical protein
VSLDLDTHNEIDHQTQETESDEATSSASAVESRPKPFTLGVVGGGVAVGLFARLIAANPSRWFELADRPLIVASAIASAIVGVGLLLFAAERDRFGGSVAFIAAVAALSWGALNWISPPFDSSATVWNTLDQPVLALLGVGNGLLLAGLIGLAFVRRGPNLSVAATLVGAVLTLAANTIALRTEWPAILLLAGAFSLVLLAWDQSPRRERRYDAPEDSPRFSRALLGLLSVALCGTAVQLWLSRMSVPRSVPAVIISGVLIAAAFISMWGVRREIEQRKSSLGEWKAWMREIRTNEFRSDMKNFEPEPAAAVPSARPDADDLESADGQPPRKLSFPNLTVPSPTPAEITGPVVVTAADLAPDQAYAPGQGLLPETAPAGMMPAEAALLGHMDPPTTELSVVIPSADDEPTIVEQPTREPEPLPLTALLPEIDAPGPVEVSDAATAERPTDVVSIALEADTAGPIPEPVPTTSLLDDDLASGPAATISLQADTPAQTQTPEPATISLQADVASASPRLAEPPRRFTLPRIDLAPSAPPVGLAPTPPEPDPNQSDPSQVEPTQPAPTQPAPAPAASTSGGAFSAFLEPETPEAVASVEESGLDSFANWLNTASNPNRLVIAVEALTLDEFESLPAPDAEVATTEISSFLSDTLPGADLVAWIDGPYYLAAMPDTSHSQLADVVQAVTKSLRPTDGVLALLRPQPGADLNSVVDHAVAGLLDARLRATEAGR